ncbi:hypothetical protein BZG29_25160 [Janthinobacterium sp. LM6]|nr:hypothetical protein BZG29_25160 [Janthinobacterium sp. LM6]
MLSHNRAANAAASVSGNEFWDPRCGHSRRPKNLAQASSHDAMRHAFFRRHAGEKKSAVTMTALLGID